MTSIYFPMTLRACLAIIFKMHFGQNHGFQNAFWKINQTLKKVSKCILDPKCIFKTQNHGFWRNYFFLILGWLSLCVLHITKNTLTLLCHLFLSKLSFLVIWHSKSYYTDTLSKHSHFIKNYFPKNYSTKKLFSKNYFPISYSPETKSKQALNLH